MTEKNALPQRRGSLLRKIFWGLVLTIVGLYLALPTFVRVIANKQLPNALTVPATLGDVDLSLLRGHVALHDLVVPQPEGFGPGNAVDMGCLSLKLVPSSLSGERLIVREVSLVDTTIHAVMDDNRVLNFAKIAQPSDEEQTPTEPSESSPVLIERIHLENVHVMWSGNPRDVTKPLNITISNLTIEVTNLLIDPNAPADHKTDISVQFEIPQGTGPAAHFALDAVLSALTGVVPSLNATTRFTGFELDTVEGILIPGARTAVGGNAFDLSMDLQVSPEVLDGEIVLESDKGNRQPFKIGGTLEKPDLPIKDLFANVLKRPVTKAFKAVGDSGKAALGVAGGAGKATLEVAKGAGGAVANVGKNAGRLLGGLIKGDIKEAGKALKDGTIGTVEGATEAVVKSGEAAVKGVASGAGDLTGNAEEKEWLATVDERFKRQHVEAKTLLQEMSWPPTRRDTSGKAEAP